MRNKIRFRKTRIKERCKQTASKETKFLWNIKKLMRRDTTGFEVLIMLTMKTTIFWDVMPCSKVEIHRRLGETLPPSSGSKMKPRK
jgi:hypothetical protein